MEKYCRDRACPCPVKKRIFFLIILAVLLCPFSALADSDVRIFKSALVWRIDTQGDYVIDEFSSSSTYEISPAYTTEGIVETVTVNYEFKGEVSLEVSADNGCHYVSVANGVPIGLAHGGKEIKWRVTLGENSGLTEVRIIYTDTSGVTAAFGRPELSGFKFRKLLYITNPLKKELFNYQISVLVARSTGAFTSGVEVGCEENIRPDFADIRFTCADGQTLLPYYLENVTGNKPNKIAAFWVKIPQIPSQGLPIYMYYGNSRAQSKSCGRDVFDFFDDFTQDELDTEIWEASTDLGGNYELSGSQLKLERATIISRSYQLKDGIIEYQGKIDAGFESRLIIRTVGENIEQVAYSSAYEGAEHCLAVGNIVKKNQTKPISAGVIYRYKVIAQGEEITFERYEIRNTQYEIPEASIIHTDEGGLKQGYIGLETGEGSTTYYDWLRVRKFAGQEPKIDTSRLALQEEVDSPLFTNVIVAKDGSLVLADKYAEGIYISQKFFAPFSTRIIVPSWTVENYELRTMNYELLVPDRVSMDISANGGVSYKTNCKNGAYYYASKRDFTPGANLKYRLKLAQIGDSETAENKVQSVTVDCRSGSIVLVAPNGGEFWEAGKRQKILWLASGYEPTYPVRIEYSLNEGRSYHPVIKQRKNMGVYFWKVPRRLSGKKLKIKVSDVLDRNIYDVSNGPVVIK